MALCPIGTDPFWYDFVCSLHYALLAQAILVCHAHLVRSLPIQSAVCNILQYFFVQYFYIVLCALYLIVILSLFFCAYYSFYCVYLVYFVMVACVCTLLVHNHFLPPGSFSVHFVSFFWLYWYFVRSLPVIMSFSLLVVLAYIFPAFAGLLIDQPM